MRNNSGPKILHCSIPPSTLDQLENTTITHVHCFLSQRKLLIQAISLSLILYDCNLYSNLRWGTVSNAFAKSVYIASICDPLSKIIVFLVVFFHYLVVLFMVATVYGE